MILPEVKPTSEPYIYLKEDECLAPVRYYYDLVKKAQENGFDSLAHWVKTLFKEKKYSKPIALVLGITPDTARRWGRSCGCVIQPHGGVKGRKWTKGREEVIT